jgi:hypothetical protein
MRWSGFGKFWAQVARATMRRRAASHFPLKATLDGATVSVTVDAIGSDEHDNDRFLSGLDGRLEITSAATSEEAGALQTRSVPLPETAPGRYETSFALDRNDASSDPRRVPGALVLRATLTRGGLPIADAAGRLAIPFAPELFAGPAPRQRALPARHPPPWPRSPPAPAAARSPAATSPPSSPPAPTAAPPYSPSAPRSSSSPWPSSWSTSSCAG